MKLAIAKYFKINFMSISPTRSIRLYWPFYREFWWLAQGWGYRYSEAASRFKTTQVQCAKSLGWLAKKDLLAFWFLTCQEISKDYGY